MRPPTDNQPSTPDVDDNPPTITRHLTVIKPTLPYQNNLHIIIMPTHPSPYVSTSPSSSPYRLHSKPPSSTPPRLDPPSYDYPSTANYGNLILLTTWLTFVIVVGSCFGVWTWAWDVGETPYAPPELEDDDTLPISGYYPALFVCTAVMSWVWVVVAWVGMKGFQHA